MNWILFGFKSCGKTTLGQKLAKRLNRTFIDTDHLLEQAYFKQTGNNLHFREIFKKIGKEDFRNLESHVLQQLTSIRDAIIAVGGGMVLLPKNVAFLAKLGQLVYLKVSKETLKQRILGQPLPAYLDPLNPEGSFEQMYKERRAIYEKIHAIPVDMETKTQDQVILELCALIQNSEDPHGQ